MSLSILRHRSFAFRAQVVAFALAIAGIAAVTSYVVAAGTAPNIKPVVISDLPLYAATTGDKPALALALSVEYPTVGAQYLSGSSYATEDATYSSSNEYLGYYNAEMCYTYQNTPTETPATGKTIADYKRFVISGPATNRACNDAFSGNFLNWASSSAIDMLRIALSGGDRYVDETNLTILQRAILPDGDPVCMWNSTNFPGKKLAKGSDNKFSGAIPIAMATAATNAGSSDIWIANTLNKIYFGTVKTGGCGNTASYTLGGPPGGYALGSIVSGSSLPSGATYCAVENGSCNVTGTQEIWYGNASYWKHAPASGTVPCSNSVFGDPISGQQKSCYLVPYTGTWTPPATLNSDGFFYARAEVCAKNSDGTLKDERDYRFCTKYPSGSYKPTGTIQRYSDQLRLAAFGYVMDQTASYSNGRYGGVLRAPMKFVGPRTFNTTGVETTPTTGNPVAEWDATSGIFATNPDGDTSQSPAISGVINYLNKFGRTGPVAGRYKKYDPAGELYGETMRYLMGLSPSPLAVSNLTPAMYDGFPVFTDWTDLDPYKDRSNTADYSCVRSNIAFIGDINTHDSSRMLTNDVPNNVPNIGYWTGIVQAFERGNTAAYLDGQGASQVTGNPNSVKNSSPKGDGFIGLAYWGHTHDIRGSTWTNNVAKQRPGLRVKSFFFDVNEYGNSSNPNNRRYNNQYFTAAKYSGFYTQPGKSTTQPYNIHGNPFKDQDGNNNNNVWQKSDEPEEAQTYFLQSDARAVLSAFDKIFSDAASAQRSIAGSASTNSNVSQSGSYLFQASYDTGTWTGDVQAYQLTAAADGSVSLSSTPAWSAETQLSTLTYGSGGATRNIYVGRRGPTPSSVATPFTTAGIETALKDDLNKVSAAAAVDGLWQQRVAYLRGDKSLEGTTFRRRFKELADIVNSGVQYVGAPATNSVYAEGYASFANAHATRTPAVYVGANDGMLHAFNATNGNELFAYIPSWMGPRLSALTDPGYSHMSYVDATPAIGVAKTGTGSAASDWRTVLVSGTGGGGKGVFALDITNPTTFDESKALWEFTQANDSDMGYVLGKSRIVKLRTSSPSASTSTYRWFAMVPAGVNNYVAGSDGTFSSTGAPTIFLLALDKPAGAAWSLNDNYYKISLPFDSELAVTNATGVINLEAYNNNAGITEYVYAGDLHGKFWALDFTGFGASDWNAGKLSRFSTGTGTTAYPMYIAKDASGNIQPITAAPGILVGSASNQHFVGFGTGKYIEASDAVSPQRNTYYTLFDNGSGAATSGTSGTVGISGRGRLVQVTADGAGNLNPVSTFAWGNGRPTTDGDMTKRAGWYYDLPDSGERVVADSTAISYTTKFVFSSLIPDSVAASGVCSVSGGSGKTYTVDLLSGIGTYKVSTVGVLGQPQVLLNVEAMTESTKADSTGRRMRTIPIITVNSGSGGMSASVGGSVSYPIGRLSWRQINNYLELKNK